MVHLPLGAYFYFEAIEKTNWNLVEALLKKITLRSLLEVIESQSTGVSKLWIF